MSILIKRRRETASDAHDTRTGAGVKHIGLLITRWILPVATVALMAWFSTRTPVFFTVDNLLAIATQNAPTFIVASVFAMLMMAGYVDLSVGSVLALVGVCAGLALNSWGLVPGIIVGLAVGAAAGTLNGVLIGMLSFSPIVVTLGGLAAARGLAQYFGQGSIYGFPDAFANFGSAATFGLPNLVIVAALLGIACIIATSCFPIGRQIIAIGVNPRAAFLIGIRVRLVVTALYILTGLAVGIAGLLQIARLNSAPSGTLGDGFEVIILTAVLLGGVPFTGGKGSIWRVLVGVWLIGTLRNGLILLDIGTELSGIITGGVLVMAAALEAARYFIHKTK
ncbi:ABC transporter permease [Sodalis sp. RH21]|uniref:ABC transporter permease n=1 Tax=unclassified Sodalis (in: enterobacteria) TaxID=2636512 RepID=UPI0039B37D89